MDISEGTNHQTSQGNQVQEYNVDWEERRPASRQWVIPHTDWGLLYAGWNSPYNSDRITAIQVMGHLKCRLGHCIFQLGWHRPQWSWGIANAS